MVGQVVGSGLIYANDGNYYRFSVDKWDFKIGANVEFGIDDSGEALSLKSYSGNLKDKSKGLNIKNPLKNISFNIPNLKFPTKNRQDKKIVDKKPNVLKESFLSKLDGIKALNSKKNKDNLEQLEVTPPKQSIEPQSSIETDVLNKSLNSTSKFSKENLFEVPNFNTTPKTSDNASFFEESKPSIPSKGIDSNFNTRKLDIDSYDNNISAPKKSEPYKQPNLKLKYDEDEINHKDKLAQSSEDLEIKSKIRKAKILAIVGFFFVVIANVIYSFFGEKLVGEETVIIPEIAAISLVLVVLYIYLTFKAMKIIGEFGRSKELHKNYLKSIFYPFIIMFVLMFLAVALGKILQSVYLTLGLGALAIIYGIYYIININKKVFMELTKITGVELFKVYFVLYAISITLIILSLVFSYFIVYAMLFVPNLINISYGFTIVTYFAMGALGFAMGALGLIMAIIYPIAWLKVKNINKVYWF